MLSSALFRTLLFGLVICIGCPAWCWSPSKEEKNLWKNLIQQGSTDELKQLIEKLRTEGQNIEQWVNFHYGSPLSQAVQHGHIPIAQLLIDNGAKINAKSNGCTLVHTAVQNNHLEMLDFLLGQQALVDGENSWTVTPLTQAIEKNHIGMVTSLLRYEASVEPRRLNGPLLEAARTGNTEIIDMLLERNARVDGDLIMGGRRPLQNAARAGHLDAVKQLLAAGAKINLQNYLQETALHHAAEHGHVEVVRYLLEQGAHVEGEDPDAGLLSANELARREGIRRLHRRDADAQGQSFVTGTPLNRAATNAHTSVVVLLLQHGADVLNVHSEARATLQQFYSPDADIIQNFHQYQTKEESFNLDIGNSDRVSFFSWLEDQLKNMRPLSKSRPEGSGRKKRAELINQAVIVTTLNVPASVDIRDFKGDKIVRIESYSLSDDFIKVGMDKRTLNQLKIILAFENGERIQYTVGNIRSPYWMEAMEQAAVLGVTIDESFFYPYADRELMEIEYNWVVNFEYSGEKKLAKSVNRQVPLKNYWSHDRNFSFDVAIPPDCLRLMFWIFPKSGTEIFMDWYRPVLARLMLSSLNSLTEFKEKAETHGVNVYCLGCGTGKDVVTCFNALNDQGIECQVRGIEKIDELIFNALLEIEESAQAGTALKESTEFISGDAYEAAKLIKQEDRKKIQGGVTVAVAEDFLVHRVLPGAYSALKILHELVQPKVADIVVIGGDHPSLVSERIATAAGWNTQQVDIYYPRNIAHLWSSKKAMNIDSVPAFVLTRLEKKEQMEGVYQRSLRRTEEPEKYPPPLRVLDLSMFGLTQDALEHFLKHKENSNITQIDLSYSYIDEKQLPAVVNLLMGFPSVQFVMASGYEPWYRLLVEAIEKQQRVKLVQRKDNQYKHELPSLDPDTAKLLWHYKTIPSARVYEPPEVSLPNSAKWKITQQEQATGYLSQKLIASYHQQMLQVLSAHNLLLQETAADNLCFFNAVSMQLGLFTSDLQIILINQLQLNQALVEAKFPAFAGEQFNILISELQQGYWGHAGLARILSWIFNKRFVILYFNSDTGQVTVQVYNPDGSGSEVIASPEETGVPANLNGEDVVLVHNGLGHWLAATNDESYLDPEPHNLFLLNPPGSQTQRLGQQVSQRYNPEVVPALLTLLMTFWQGKFK